MDIPNDIDVILVAPKGSGRTVRTLFREGRGINSSIAVFQDVTGKAEEKAVALGVAVGSGYLYKTTFEKEVYSDLYGERGCLMGGIHGMFLAQYEVLRERGHSPSEAFNETVEEATQSLYPLIGQNGMDYMYAACSTTARRGAIDWSKRFKETLKPLFSELYDSVKDGTETKKALEFNSRKDYREAFEKEMADIRGLEIWRVSCLYRKRDTYANYLRLERLCDLFAQRTSNLAGQIFAALDFGMLPNVDSKRRSKVCFHPMYYVRILSVALSHLCRVENAQNAFALQLYSSCICRCSLVSQIIIVAS